MDREGLLGVRMCMCLCACVCDYPQFSDLHDDPKYVYGSLEHLTERLRALHIRTSKSLEENSHGYFPDLES